MRDILELFDAVDLMLGSGEGVVPPGVLDAAHHDVGFLRRRAAGAGTTLVVALAGGTGTGKSSVLNAIAGEEVASVSRLRPHTERPLAWLPEGADSTVVQLLEELGVADRTTHVRLPGVAVVDLPGVDSIASSHRERAERVLAGADAIVWVLDPEKYRDEILHDEFLAPRVRHRDQTAFVLNKIDRLGEDDAAKITSSVRNALTEGGYEEPIVFPLAARPASGQPMAIGPLMAYLARQLDVKKAAYGKLLSDVAATVRTVGMAANVWHGAAEGFAERWQATRDEALARLEPGVDVAREDAICEVEDLIATIAADIGGHVGDALRTVVGAEEVETVMTSVQQAVAAGDLAAARDEMDTRVGAPLRDILVRRNRFAALVALTHVGARQLGHRYGAVVR
jgi:GTP-binding protein EngB required for normal cell division